MSIKITQLPIRGFLQISGEEARDFLQSLVTNNLHRLETQAYIYACLLTPQGKFLHDFFIWRNESGLLLECEAGERCDDLARRLSLYKLRAKVSITQLDDNPVFVSWGDVNGDDPRLPELGSRSLLPLEANTLFKDYDAHRLSLGVPDGSRDMIIEKTTMAEARIDKLNGIDYKKGCYIGQELTARMYYRDLGKRFLYPLKSDSPLQTGPLLHAEKTIADIRSVQGNYGLALIRRDHFDDWPLKSIKPYTLNWMDTHD